MGNDNHVVIGDDKIVDYIQSENSLNRVKRLFSKREDKPGMYSEFRACQLISGAVATFVGTVAFTYSAPRCKENYIAANVVTAYESKWKASVRAQDAYFYGGAKRLIKYGFITYMAVYTFSMLGQAIELYRCKTSAVNYAASGTVVGVVSRCLVGPKAMLAGGFIGGYAGTVIGFAVTSGMIYAGINIEKRYANEIRKKLEDKMYYEEYSRRITAQLAAQDTKQTTQKVSTPV